MHRKHEMSEKNKMHQKHEMSEKIKCIENMK